MDSFNGEAFIYISQISADKIKQNEWVRHAAVMESIRSA
jgi:hypothetical protein